MGLQGALTSSEWSTKFNKKNKAIVSRLRFNYTRGWSSAGKKCGCLQTQKIENDWSETTGYSGCIFWRKTGVSLQKTPSEVSISLVLKIYLWFAKNCNLGSRTWWTLRVSSNLRSSTMLWSFRCRGDVQMWNMCVKCMWNEGHRPWPRARWCLGETKPAVTMDLPPWTTSSGSSQCSWTKGDPVSLYTSTAKPWSPLPPTESNSTAKTPPLQQMSIQNPSITSAETQAPSEAIQVKKVIFWRRLALSAKHTDSSGPSGS